MAKNTTLLALAAALTALASAITEECGSAAAAPETTTGEEAPAPSKRGRPPGKPAAEKEAPESKTLDELKEIIKPLVAEGRGAEIKAILKKLDCEALKDLPAEKQAAFLKDVEALSI